MEIIFLVILIADLFIAEAVGRELLRIELAAEKDKPGLLYPRCAVCVLHVELCCLKLVLVPPAVAAAVVERGAVLLGQDAQRVGVGLVYDFLRVAGRAQVDGCNALVPEYAKSAPACGHGVYPPSMHGAISIFRFCAGCYQKPVFSN